MQVVEVGPAGLSFVILAVGSILVLVGLIALVAAVIRRLRDQD